MSLHAVTDTPARAVQLVEDIDALRGYPRDGTTTHAVPLAHADGRRAVPLDGLTDDEIVALDLTDFDLDTLDESWFPGGY